MNAHVVTEPLVAIEGLTVSLPQGSDRLRAVNSIDLDIAPGRILCLVGESGSGKSMTAHAIMGLVPKPLVCSGSIRFDGQNLIGLAADRHRAIRGQRIGMIFQEPMAALNPVMRVGRQIEEVFRYHGIPGPYDARVVKLLGDMGLPEPETLRHAFPFSLSGGQRQRIGIARALALEPDVLVADEPVSALDVSIQARVLDLLADLQRRLKLGMLFITHDLRVAAQICDQVAVMQRGRIVEMGASSEVLFRPTQDYTKLLIDSIPGRGAFAVRPSAK